MANINKPQAKTLVDDKGRVILDWDAFFGRLAAALSGPLSLQTYSVSQLPDPTKFEGCIVYVNNESGGKTVAFSDAINWRRVRDLAVVS